MRPVTKLIQSTLSYRTEKRFKLNITIPDRLPTTLNVSSGATRKEICLYHYLKLKTEMIC